MTTKAHYLEERISKLENQCGHCGENHPLTGHDDDCEWHFVGGAYLQAECTCGDNVMGPHGYVSISLECLDFNTN